MIKEITAKTIALKNKYPPEHWFGTNYTINIYRGCNHGCMYCDSRSECYRVEDFDQVHQKKDAISILSKELLGKRTKGIIGMGSMSDPYNSAEASSKLTQQALKVIRDTGFGVTIATKSPLITRDIDILQSFPSHQDVLVKMTITCIDDSLSRIIEPHVAPSSKRFEAIAKLRQADIFCGILLMPILPYINDTEENIIGIVKAAKNVGAKFIYPMFGVTLRDRQRDYFYQQLDIHFPGLSNTYRKVYGEKYNCHSAKAKDLYHVFEKECKKHNILYRMPDIIKAYQHQPIQIEQFRLPI